MSPPLHLLFRLAYRLAETVIYFFMNTVFVFKPDKIGHIVNCRLQIMTGLPVIFTHFTCLLPSEEPEFYLLIRHRHCPYISDFGQIVL